MLTKPALCVEFIDLSHKLTNYLLSSESINRKQGKRHENDCRIVGFFVAAGFLHELPLSHIRWLETPFGGNGFFQEDKARKEQDAVL